MTDLQKAVRRDNLHAVLTYIVEGQDLNQRDSNGYSPLHLAVRGGNVDMVKLLVKMGNVDKDARDRKGSSPIHHAVLMKDKKIIEFLVSQGAKLNIKNNDGLTPLDLATNQGNPDLAACLLHKRASLLSETVEKWCCTQMKVLKVNFKWTINDFSLCRQNSGEMLTSSIFDMGDTAEFRWYLRLYPRGNSEKSKDFVSLFLYLDSSSKSDIRAKFNFSVLNKDNRKTHTKLSLYDFVAGGDDWGYHRFIQRDVLFDESNGLLPDDQLRILCEVDLVKCSVNVAGPSTSLRRNVPQYSLGNDLGELLQSGKFTDVTIVVGDGVEIPAHKNILAARSPVFAAMFDHDMEEKTSSRVTIVDVEENVVRKMLQFIYTGKLYNPEEMAKELLAAADKYAVETLKLVCETTLAGKLSVENAADTFVISDLHSALVLKEQAVHFIVNNAKSVMGTQGWRTMACSQPHLIEEAFQALVGKYEN